MTYPQTVKRPLTGSVTGLVWKIADDLLIEKEQVPGFKEVWELYSSGDPSRNINTCRTQFSRWKKNHANHFKRGPRPFVENAGVQLVIGADGRILIPAEIRNALELKGGDIVNAKISDGELRLTSSAAALKKVQALVQELVPSDVSMAQELIAERRAEVQK